MYRVGGAKLVTVEIVRPVHTVIAVQVFRVRIASLIVGISLGAVDLVHIPAATAPAPVVRRKGLRFILGIADHPGVVDTVSVQVPEVVLVAGVVIVHTLHGPLLSGSLAPDAPGRVRPHALVQPRVFAIIQDAVADVGRIVKRIILRIQLAVGHHVFTDLAHVEIDGRFRVRLGVLDVQHHFNELAVRLVVETGGEGAHDAVPGDLGVYPFPAQVVHLRVQLEHQNVRLLGHIAVQLPVGPDVLDGHSPIGVVPVEAVTNVVVVIDGGWAEPLGQFDGMACCVPVLALHTQWRRPLGSFEVIDIGHPLVVPRRGVVQAVGVGKNLGDLAFDRHLRGGVCIDQGQRVDHRGHEVRPKPKAGVHVPDEVSQRLVAHFDPLVQRFLVEMEQRQADEAVFPEGVLEPYPQQGSLVQLEDLPGLVVDLQVRPRIEGLFLQNGDLARQVINDVVLVLDELGAVEVDLFGTLQHVDAQVDIR